MSLDIRASGSEGLGSPWGPSGNIECDLKRACPPRAGEAGISVARCAFQGTGRALAAFKHALYLPVCRGYL